MENVYKIQLEPIIDLSNINNLYNACKEALNDNVTLIDIDASKVERLKTPVFQLIIGFQNKVKLLEKKIIISSPSEEFIAMARCLSLWEIIKTV